MDKAANPGLETLLHQVAGALDVDLKKSLVRQSKVERRRAVDNG